jgi:hypothetical protein
MSSEIDDLEAYADFDHRERSAYYRNPNERARTKRAQARKVRNAAMLKRDQEVFDRLGLPKGDGK